MEREKQVKGEDGGEALPMRIPQYAAPEQSVPLHNCIA